MLQGRCAQFNTHTNNNRIFILRLLVNSLFWSIICLFILWLLETIIYITVCFLHHCLFLSSLCVSIITVCFSHCCVFLSSLCVSVITVCFHHHCVFPSSLCVSVTSMCFVCFGHGCVFPTNSPPPLSLSLSGVSNGRFRPCFLTKQTNKDIALTNKHTIA